jgi:transposase
MGQYNLKVSAAGRPGYQPATMLKIYVYGYLNLCAVSTYGTDLVLV